VKEKTAKHGDAAGNLTETPLIIYSRGIMISSMDQKEKKGDRESRFQRHFLSLDS
jgi:hypothetical protein